MSAYHRPENLGRRACEPERAPASDTRGGDRRVPGRRRRDRVGEAGHRPPGRPADPGRQRPRRPLGHPPLSGPGRDRRPRHLDRSDQIRSADVVRLRAPGRPGGRRAADPEPRARWPATSATPRPRRDGVPALLVLDAHVRLQRRGGSRELPLVRNRDRSSSVCGAGRGATAPAVAARRVHHRQPPHPPAARRADDRDRHPLSRRGCRAPPFSSSARGATW